MQDREDSVVTKMTAVIDVGNTDGNFRSKMKMMRQVNFYAWHYRYSTVNIFDRQPYRQEHITLDRAANDEQQDNGSLSFSEDTTERCQY